MNSRHKVPALIGLATIAVAVVMIATVKAQPSQSVSDDFTNAVLAEVKDAQGRVVLTGKFVVSDEEDAEIERKATLTPTRVDADAAGEAEVEISGLGNSRRQEVEFSMRNVQPGGVFTCFIDGRVFATVTADERGRAEIERDVALPGTSQPR
jgi:hypothetical protein